MQALKKSESLNLILADTLKQADEGDKEKLCECNGQIIDYITQLKAQRKEVMTLIEKQKLEKSNLEVEMERMAYKLTLIDKGLKQRQQALDHYNKKIAAAEETYKVLLEKSQVLLDLVKNDLVELESIMNKKVGTTSEETLSYIDDEQCPNRCGSRMIP